MVVSDNSKLLAEWDFEKNKSLGLNPNKLRIKSNKKVWWKCEKGHSWQMEVYHRSDGRNCPFCNNKRVLKGFNDLKTLFPEIAEEWHPTQNSDKCIDDYVQGSAARVVWQCKTCHHVWSTSIRLRTQRGTGCPECAKRSRADARIKTMIMTRGSLDDPKLLAEWDYTKNDKQPQEYLFSSGKKVWWKCSKCGHQWKAVISNRACLGRGCPSCARKTKDPGKNCLLETHPELAKEFHPSKNHPLTARDVYAGSARKVWWLCPAGHSYVASLLHRGHGTNCPKCNSGRQTSFAEQAVFFYIKQLFPDAQNRVLGILDHRMELDIFIPSIRLAIEYDGAFWHSQKKVNKRERDERKYKQCQTKKIRLIRIREAADEETHGLADEVWHMRDLENMDQLSRMIQLLLDKLDPNSNMWTRTRNQWHSNICVDVRRDEFKIRAYQQPLKSGSVADLYPEIAKMWHPTKNGDITPQKVSPGSMQRVWWRCPICHAEWQSSVYSRTRGKHGCPSCYKEKIKKNHPNAIPIYQYSEDWKLIRVWESISSAGRALKISSGDISSCAKHVRNFAGGFHWEYQRVDQEDKR